MNETLDDFVRDEIYQLHQFRTHWLTKHKENPEQYPMEVDNWWEQFIAYTERGDFS